MSAHLREAWRKLAMNRDTIAYIMKYGPAIDERGAALMQSGSGGVVHIWTKYLQDRRDEPSAEASMRQAKTETGWPAACARFITSPSNRGFWTREDLQYLTGDYAETPAELCKDCDKIWRAS